MAYYTIVRFILFADEQLMFGIIMRPSLFHSIKAMCNTVFKSLIIITFQKPNYCRDSYTAFREVL